MKWKAVGRSEIGTSHQKQGIVSQDYGNYRIFKDVIVGAVAVNELTICGKVDSHYYSQTYGKCYWCDRSTKLGVDIFPGFAKKHTSYKDKDADAYINSGVAHADTYNNRGFSRYLLGDTQGAINDYNQALKINPYYALAYSNRGNARSALGDYQGAIDELSQHKYCQHLR